MVLQRVKSVVIYSRLRKSAKLSHQPFEIGSARVKSCPVMQIEISVIWEKFITRSRPFESIDSLLSLDSLIVFIYGAIFEFHFCSKLFISDGIKRVLKKFVTKICKLVGKVQTCWDKNMISFELASIINEAFGKFKFISDYLPGATLKFWLYYLSLLIHLINIKFARSSIIIIKYVRKDSRTCKRKTAFYKLWLPQKL